MQIKESSALVLLSGGIDSAVLLYYVKEVLGYSKVEAILFHYGQRHSVELEYARQLAYESSTPHKTIRVDLTQFGSSSLTSEDKDLSVAVPARNSIFLSLAAAYAEVEQFEDIFIGVNAGDFTIFPDCRENFIQLMSQALSTGNGVRGVYAPFVNKSKQNIVTLGHLLNVPFRLTWSCYYPVNRHTPCGKCHACIERDGVLL